MELSSRARSVFRLQEYGSRPRIDGFELVELRRSHDDGGSMTELMRLTGSRPQGLAGFQPVQVNYSCLEPGVVKAFHVHRKQTDVWFVPPEDRVLLVVADVREGSATEGEQLRMMLGDGRSALVRIPPGVAHGCRNLGQRAARLFYFTDLLFSPDPAECDEGRLPWDFLGREIWEVRWD